MPDTADDRRRFLSYLTGALLSVLGLLLAVPAVGYLVAPLRRRKAERAAGSFVDAGPVADLPVREWRLRTVALDQEDAWKKKGQVRHSLWVQRTGEGDQALTVLSPLCPHLGCPVNWHPDKGQKGQFDCPCHGGVFSADGEHVSGPPPRSMDPLTFEVRAGRLWVHWQDFRIGVPERVPVST
jgi:menaquinol-cytochrome c reductase iron-sulfur subunit